jgi:hypothetical protein
MYPMVTKHFKFSDATAGRLRELADSLAVNQQDVVRESIRLLSVAVREQRQGNSLAVVNGETVLHRLLGFWEDVKRDGKHCDEFQRKEPACQ